MKQLYGEIFASSEIWWYSSIKLILHAFPALLNQWLEAVKKKTSPVRELISSDPEDIAYAQQICATNEHDKIRIVPPNFPLSIDMAIFGNKVAIFTLKNIFALLIESEDVAAPPSVRSTSSPGRARRH